MKLLSIELVNFRNILKCCLSLNGGRNFLLGMNGQGKTSILEGIYFLSTLRSFRSSHLSTCIRNKELEFTIKSHIEHPLLGDIQVKGSFNEKGKRFQVNEQTLKQSTECLGMMPSTILCAEDVELLRDGPSVRRKFIDITLSLIDKEYLHNLRNYNRALIERNAALKTQHTPVAVFEAFENILSEKGIFILKKRSQTIALLSQFINNTYKQLSANPSEEVTLTYKPDWPNCEEITIEQLRRNYDRERNMDLRYQTTRHGIHKDDIAIHLNELDARHFSSEGQQRSIVLGFKLAQSQMIHHTTNVYPILLADDILGQLDTQRRQNFWSLIPKNQQLIATGTTLPEFNFSDVHKIHNGEAL
jgi:DNA replication and repair protein RecF